ncbi:MAG TPA: hypothetical protein VKA38_11435, partial [Draconibacterium sp.]|nr:hypothetical protein [Draconibacterium sp.]
MKKLSLVMLIAVFWGCVQKESVKKADNYLPETPKLASDKMTPEVLWAFGRLGGAQVSPDGKTVLYTVTYYNIQENRSYRDIYSIPLEGGEATNLTNSAANESDALWRPDGKKIGYLSSASGSTQLWEMNPDGSGVKQISDIDGGIFGFGYSPDQSKIYYLKSVKLDKSVNDIYPDLPKANARLETDIMYRHWDTWHD